MIGCAKWAQVTKALRETKAPWGTCCLRPTSWTKSNNTHQQKPVPIYLCTMDGNQHTNLPNPARRCLTLHEALETSAATPACSTARPTPPAASRHLVQPPRCCPPGGCWNGGRRVAPSLLHVRVLQAPLYSSGKEECFVLSPFFFSLSKDTCSQCSAAEAGVNTGWSHLLLATAFPARLLKNAFFSRNVQWKQNDSSCSRVICHAEGSMCSLPGRYAHLYSMFIQWKSLGFEVQL